MAPSKAVARSFPPGLHIRTSQAMYFYNHGGPIYAPRQVPDLTLAHIMNSVQPAPASATLKSPVNGNLTESSTTWAVDTNSCGEPSF